MALSQSVCSGSHRHSRCEGIKRIEWSGNGNQANEWSTTNQMNATQRNTTQRHALWHPQCPSPSIPTPSGHHFPKTMLNSTLQWLSAVTAKGLRAMTNRTTFTPTWWRWLLCHEYKDNVNFRTTTETRTETRTHTHTQMYPPATFSGFAGFVFDFVVFHASA